MHSREVEVVLGPDLVRVKRRVQVVVPRQRPQRARRNDLEHHLPPRASREVYSHSAVQQEKADHAAGSSSIVRAPHRTCPFAFNFPQ